MCLQEGSLSPELYSDTEDDESDTEGATEDDEYYEDDETESDGEYDDDDDVEIVSRSCSESDGDSEQCDNKVGFYFLTLPTLNYFCIVMMEKPRQLTLRYSPFHKQTSKDTYILYSLCASVYVLQLFCLMSLSQYPKPILLTHFCGIFAPSNNFFSAPLIQI